FLLLPAGPLPQDRCTETFVLRRSPGILVLVLMQSACRTGTERNASPIRQFPGRRRLNLRRNNENRGTLPAAEARLRAAASPAWGAHGTVIQIGTPDEGGHTTVSCLRNPEKCRAPPTLAAGPFP